MTHSDNVPDQNVSPCKLAEAFPSQNLYISAVHLQAPLQKFESVRKATVYPAFGRPSKQSLYLSLQEVIMMITSIQKQCRCTSPAEAMDHRQVDNNPKTLLVQKSTLIL